ncbi:hypothetical protein GJ744_010047 [Endocarpon pusillum]|uniref:Uncharacterized protein n=1 Tax=Endocarpon pusillum TaxID=364733 RepID=A0A8H7E4I6_9EURO|nr:hypothetical protein GJ744_010047 [Endocarpon pusillum]
MCAGNEDLEKVVVGYHGEKAHPPAALQGLYKLNEGRKTIVAAKWNLSGTDAMYKAQVWLDLLMSIPKEEAHTEEDLVARAIYITACRCVNRGRWIKDIQSAYSQSRGNGLSRSVAAHNTGYGQRCSIMFDLP